MAPERGRARFVSSSFRFPAFTLLVCIHPRFRRSGNLHDRATQRHQSLCASCLRACCWMLKNYLFVPLSAILDGRRGGEREAQRAYAESLRTLEKADRRRGREALGGAARGAEDRARTCAPRASRFWMRSSPRPRPRPRGDRPRQQRDRVAGRGLRRGSSPNAPGASPASSPKRSSGESSPRELSAAPSRGLLRRPSSLGRGRRARREVPGVPLWIWQILNLVLFFAVLLYFIARPMAEAFRKRQQEIEERRREAEKQRAASSSSPRRSGSARPASNARSRRSAGRAWRRESARAALSERATKRPRASARSPRRKSRGGSRPRKRSSAKAAADLTATAATEIVSREITDEDRRRLLTESMAR